MKRLLILFLSSVFYSCPAMASIQNNTQSLHLDWLDRNIEPGQNYFEYANGGWQTMNPIPADYARISAIRILEDNIQSFIHGMLVNLSQQANLKPNSLQQKLADFYLSGMDEVSTNKAGIKPLFPELDRISNINNLADLQKVVAHLQMIGVDVLFTFSEMQDYKDNRRVIAVISQGGLGLPDRDYYLNDSATSKKIRLAYITHIAKMFVLLGESEKQAVHEAKVVVKIETALAKAHMPRTKKRDPYAVYHLMNANELHKLTPNFSWQQYLNDIGYSNIDSINLATYDYFKTMNDELETVALQDWKLYLRWHLVHTFAPFLSQPFSDEDFNLQSQLTGVKTPLPRWKRVVEAENRALGFAIGQLYVEKQFSPDAKAAAQTMLDHIKTALKKDLQQLDWMTSETRKAALNKLNLMQSRIGYPDKWRDYAALKIDRGPYVLNIMRANEFLIRYALNKIGKPVDKNEWLMTPQTVNAYYDPSQNRLNIPAGILQSPFFDINAPVAVNYGGLGAVIGHEMTHGFDDQGAQFDGSGNLHNWWTRADLEKFKKVTRCIENQFSRYTVNGDLHVQGKLVVGEATADLGGLMLSYRALHDIETYKQAKNIAGLTPDQQFFLSAAHIWATNIEPQEARRLLLTNPHPPAIFRVNGTVANMPAFQHAYGLTQQSPMINKPICVIW